MSTTEAKEMIADTAITTQRVITVVTTRGEKRKIPFNGNEWADLKRVLENSGVDAEGNSYSGYSLSNMKCVESINRSTLEHPKAVVPDGNFNLFLMPYKSKSGGPARDKVKELFAQNREAAKAHFGNYTQVKEEVLAELLKTYQGGVSIPTSTTKKVEPKKAEAIADVVESVKTSKDVVTPMTTSQKLAYAIDLLVQVSTEISNVPSTNSENPVTARAKSQADIDAEKQAEIDRKNKEEQDRKAEEARKQKEEEDRKIKAEQDDIMSGFNDIQR